MTASRANRTSTTRPAGPAVAGGPPSAAPALDFAVERVEALRPSAAPTLRFTLALDAGGAAVLGSIQPHTQVSHGRD